MSADEEVPGREVAYRLFAAEYDDASLSYAESDEERAPNYVVTPTGARLNRVFVVGTLTEVTRVNDEMVRARVVDPTGAFVVYAGQYQPDELAALESIDPPAFVAVTGKARTFEPDDGDRVYTSIRPESVATVDAETRDRWAVTAAERTVDRIDAFAAAADLEADGEALTDALLEADVDAGLADGVPLARDHYGTTPSYLAALRECALEAVEVVAGERDQVSGLDVGPDDASDPTATFGSLADRSLEAPASATPAADSESAEPVAATVGESESEPDAAASGSVVGTAGDGADGDPTDAAVGSGGSDGGVDAEEERLGDDESDVEADADSSDPTDEEAALESDPSEPGSGAADEEADLEGADAGGMYEMDDEEREELEEEFGAEFTTGSEVDGPGEADIDVPADEETGDDGDAAGVDDESTDAGDDLGAAPTSGLEPEAAEAADEPDSAGEAAADDAEPDRESSDSSDDGSAEPVEDDAASDDDAAEDVDLESYVVETMEELDDGDGADRSALVEAVAEETGATPADVESAIDDALMGGQCYEPDDETLKAI